MAYHTVYRDIFASGNFRENDPIKACLFFAVSIFRYFIKERNHCVNFSLFYKRKTFRFDQKYLFIQRFVFVKNKVSTA